MSDFDGLYLCPVCEDRYITASEEMCHACRYQPRAHRRPPTYSFYEVLKVCPICADRDIPSSHDMCHVCRDEIKDDEL